MLRIDIGHDADHRGESQEGTITFVGFGDEPSATSEAGSASLGSAEDSTANDRGGV